METPDYEKGLWYCAYCHHGYAIIMGMETTDEPQCPRHPNIILTFLPKGERANLKPRYKEIDIP